jgi:uncharacterized surface protein with fasciclin (FAS1) repeats
VARTEFGVAIGSILIVAGVLAIPILAPAPTVAPLVIPHVLPKPTATSTASPSSDLVGTGCAAYTAQTPTGPGSIDGMAQSPVATAMASNPMLTTLNSAVSGTFNPKVNLVATLNGAQFTVFAPVDSAFAKLPPKTLASLKLSSNAAKLTGILDYHLVAGQFLPASVAGTRPTLQGGSLTITGTGADIKVNGASLICGGIHTANATVYLIDTVLTAPAN